MTKNHNDNSSTQYEMDEQKKVNPTWEAFGKYPGAFTILDPSILD